MTKAEQAKAEERMAISFKIALRSRGIPEQAAVYMTRRAIVLYRRYMRVNKPDHALRMLSDERAGAMAEALKKGAELV